MHLHAVLIICQHGMMLYVPQQHLEAGMHVLASLFTQVVPVMRLHVSKLDMPCIRTHHLCLDLRKCRVMYPASSWHLCAGSIP